MAFDVVITKVAEDYEEVLRKISDNPFLFHHYSKRNLFFLSMEFDDN